ncbi:MAG: ROK family glucokinase [bacterium]|nr:ROK family glucokinase [bacterium]
MYCIGIDLGGTTIKAGIVDETYQIVKADAVPTQASKGAEAMVKDMVDLVLGLLSDAEISMSEIAAIGLGVPGTANKETGMVEYANNLGFENEPLVPLLQKYFDKPIYFDNDANAAAWGEYLAGCGRGHKSMVMVTLGTGVGGGVILDGQLYEGCNYAAGEFGHFVIQCEGLPCNCGRRGCFEMYASASGLIRMTKEAMQQEGGRSSILWELCGKNPENVNGKLLFEAVANEDETAKKVLEKYIYYLSVGITDIINMFQPEVLCIGGGISKAGDVILTPLKKLVDEQIYTRTSKVKTEIVIASLDNDAGIIGAAMLQE